MRMDIAVKEQASQINALIESNVNPAGSTKSSTIVGVEKMIIHTDLKDKSNSIMKIIHSPGKQP